MQKWEYETIILEANGFFERCPEPKGRTTVQVLKYLNEMGANGWELVSATTATGDGHYHMLYMKRPAS
jgi:hypothetical protein